MITTTKSQAIEQYKHELRYQTRGAIYNNKMAAYEVAQLEALIEEAHSWYYHLIEYLDIWTDETFDQMLGKAHKVIADIHKLTEENR